VFCPKLDSNSLFFFLQLRRKKHLDLTRSQMELSRASCAVIPNLLWPRWGTDHQEPGPDLSGPLSPPAELASGEDYTSKKCTWTEKDSALVNLPQTTHFPHIPHEWRIKQNVLPSLHILILLVCLFAFVLPGVKPRAFSIQTSAIALSYIFPVTTCFLYQYLSLPSPYLPQVEISNIHIVSFHPYLQLINKPCGFH
jgi:hypothetical protein